MGAILCSKDLILLLYGEKYVSGLSIFIIYLFVTLIRFANMSIIFSAAGNTKIIMILSIILLIANIILSIMMIKLMGPIGCAFATLIVSIIGNGYIFIKAKDILGKSLFAVLDWKIYIKLLLYTLLIGGGIYIIKENSSIISSLPIFFSIGIPYCIFVAGLLFIFKRKLLSYIKNIG